MRVIAKESSRQHRKRNSAPNASSALSTLPLVCKTYLLLGSVVSGRDSLTSSSLFDAAFFQYSCSSSVVVLVLLNELPVEGESFTSQLERKQFAGGREPPCREQLHARRCRSLRACTATEQRRKILFLVNFPKGENVWGPFPITSTGVLRVVSGVLASFQGRLREGRHFLQKIHHPTMIILLHCRPDEKGKRHDRQTPQQECKLLLESRWPAAGPDRPTRYPLLQGSVVLSLSPCAGGYRIHQTYPPSTERSRLNVVVFSTPLSQSVSQVVSSRDTYICMRFPPLCGTASKSSTHSTAVVLYI